MPKKIILIIFGIFIVITIAFGAYFLGRSQSDSDTPVATDITPATPPTQKTSKTPTCPSTLTVAESKTVNSWKTYEDSADGYSFKHPADWEVTPQGSTSVILTDDAALFSFQFGRLDEDFQSGYAVESKENTDIDCISVQRVSLMGKPPGGENFRRIVTKVTKNGTTYTALITFRFVDKATTGSLIETYNTILKTIKFN